MTTIILFALWYLVGIVPTILLWRKDRDLHLWEFLGILVLGIAGPISAVAAWLVIGPYVYDPIVFRRRP